MTYKGRAYSYGSLRSTLEGFLLIKLRMNALPMVSVILNILKYTNHIHT